MHTASLDGWRHDHGFGMERVKAGERRTLIVLAVTAATMALEIAGGIAFGSMALLADGLHMGSHTAALGVSAFAYYHTRRHAKDPRFNFGTGKVASLAAFASAVMLAIFALVMAWESIERFISPVDIDFNAALLVFTASIGVNGLCLLILGRKHHSGADHGHTHDESRHHSNSAPAKGIADHRPDRKKDHILWSAYLHVATDAVTSVLAVFALLAGKYFGQEWLDPFMGLVAAALVVRWSWGLLRASAQVLLDMQAPEEVRTSIRRSIESESDNRVSDLHVWRVGPGIYAAETAVVTSEPKSPDHYRQLVPKDAGVVHMTVEVWQCPTAQKRGEEGVPLAGAPIP